jgi:hypothetical protein
MDKIETSVALTMSPDAGRVFFAALMYAAARIPQDKGEHADSEMSHADWLRWGANRLDAAIRATELERLQAGQWRDYTIENYGEGTYDTCVVCRSDGGCEWLRANVEGRYLTLGEAVDAAQEHVAWHAKQEAEESAVDQPVSSSVASKTEGDQL